MKSSKIKIISVCTAIAILCATLAGCAISSEKEESIVEKLLNNSYTSGEQIHDDLMKFKKSRFTKEIKQTFAELDEEVLIYVAAALVERINEYSEKEIIEMITDEETDTFLKVTLVQIYGGSSDFENKTDKGNKTIRDLLSDGSVEDELKCNIIMFMNFDDEEGIGMLKEIAASDNEELAARANKRLKAIESYKEKKP